MVEIENIQLVQMDFALQEFLSRNERTLSLKAKKLAM